MIKDISLVYVYVYHDNLIVSTAWDYQWVSNLCLFITHYKPICMEIDAHLFNILYIKCKFPLKCIEVKFIMYLTKTQDGAAVL